MVWCGNLFVDILLFFFSCLIMDCCISVFYCYLLEMEIGIICVMFFNMLLFLGILIFLRVVVLFV